MVRHLRVYETFGFSTADGRRLTARDRTATARHRIAGAEAAPTGAGYPNERGSGALGRGPLIRVQSLPAQEALLLGVKFRFADHAIRPELRQLRQFIGDALPAIW